MIPKFETTRKLDIPIGRGLKKIVFFSIEKVATAIVEASSHSLDGYVSMSDVSRVLDMLHSIVQKVL